MADSKISALTGATTPLAGTEVLPIVQSGSTVKVSVTNLTAGRAVSATEVTASTGNFVATATNKGLTTASAVPLGFGTNGSTAQMTLSTAGILSTPTDASFNSVSVGAGGGTGLRNVAVGFEALKANTTADRTVAIGYQAGTTGTTGISYSTYVGFRAGQNATGLGNVFIGDTVGQLVTSGFANAFIGSNNAVTGSAGSVMTTGSKNVILGSFTGNQGGLDIRASDNYVIISDGTGNLRLTVDASGIVTMPAYGAGAATFSAAGVISSVSDENWKRKDGVPLNPVEMINKLQPGYWYYNDEKKATFGTDRQLGFYAQNVNAAIGPEAAPVPESMTLTDADGVETLQQKPWGYYDRSVLAVVVMALQEALATIKTLETRIQALEAKI